jgi:hypothetical protein
MKNVGGVSTAGGSAAGPVGTAPTVRPNVTTRVVTKRRIGIARGPGSDRGYRIQLRRFDILYSFLISF